MPLVPIQGHPSGRGSQALRTASLGRDGAGLEVPNSGLRAKGDLGVIILYQGREGGPPARGTKETALDQTLLLFLIGAQGTGNGHSGLCRHQCPVTGAPTDWPHLGQCEIQGKLLSTLLGHAFNPRTWEDQKFKANGNYISIMLVRPTQNPASKNPLGPMRGLSR